MIGNGESNRVFKLQVSSAMSDGYAIGTAVKWKWSGSWAHGKITERFVEKVTRTIKGTEVVREASREEPAYLIEQDDGDRVLKSHSEVQKK